MDCGGANVFGSADDSLYIEIRRADRDRFVANARMWSVPVRFCVDDAGTDSHLTASARDANGNLAPVRNQKFSDRQETNYVTKALTANDLSNFPRCGRRSFFVACLQCAATWQTTRIDRLPLLIDIILTFRKTLDHGLQTLLIDSIRRLFS